MAGRNVLVDKPLCLNGDEAEQMLEAHQQRPNQVHPPFHALLKYSASGLQGNPIPCTSSHARKVIRRTRANQQSKMTQHCKSRP